MRKPDFFMSSSESYAFESPRRCWAGKRLTLGTRDDLMLIRVDPPVRGADLGLAESDIAEWVIATRHCGSSLFPPSGWPIQVYVLYAPLAAVRDELGLDECRNMAWATLFPDREEAAKLKAR